MRQLEPLPLTFQQRWLWDLIQGHRDWNCTVTYAFRLRGELQVGVLERSLQELVRRHGALRSRVVMFDGAPGMDVSRSPIDEMEVASVEGDSEAEVAAAARLSFEEFSDRIVSPTRDALFGVRLLRLADAEHWLLVAIHRLIADCFSSEQIFRELWSIYRELARGRTSPFPSDPGQYADYALWQREAGPEWQQRHEAYWTKRLEGARNLLWPNEPGSTGVRRGVNGRMSVRFEAELSRAVQEFARRTRSLAAMVMLSVYATVLFRWCGQKDFVVPFNVAGRQSEHRSVVGYFSHILYLRIELIAEETFTALLGRVSNEFFRAMAHQDFGRMAVLRPDLLTGAFFQWTTWHPDAALELPSCEGPVEPDVTRIPLRDFAVGLSALPPGMVDVDITFFDTTDGIFAQGVYRADRFAPKTVDALMEDLRQTTEVFIRDPNALVSIGRDFHERKLNLGCAAR